MSTKIRTYRSDPETERMLAEMAEERCCSFGAVIKAAIKSMYRQTVGRKK